MQRLFRAMLPFAISGFLLLMLLRPAPAMQGAREGLLVFTSSVLPAVLPFFVLSSLLIQCSGPGSGKRRPGLVAKAFRLGRPAAGALWLCLLIGAPGGARLAAQLHKSGRIEKDEAARLLAAGTLTGPMFLLGTVGELLQSRLLGAFVLGTTTLCALLNGLLWRGYGKDAAPQTGAQAQIKTISLSQALPAALSDSAQAALVIACAMAVFSALLSSLRAIGLFAGLERALSFALPRTAVEPLFSGIVEIGVGCRSACLSALPLYARLLLLCVLSGFGGLSILCQAACFIKGLVPVRVYLLQRLSHALLCLLLCALAKPLLLPALPAWSVLARPSAGEKILFSYLVLGCALGFLLLMRLISLRR